MTEKGFGLLGAAILLGLAVLGLILLNLAIVVFV